MAAHVCLFAFPTFLYSIVSILSILNEILDPSGIHRVYKSGPASQVFMAQELIARGKTVVILLASAAEMPLYKALIRLFAPSEDQDAFWERQWITFPPITPGKEQRRLWGERWSGLFSLTQGGRGRGILLPLENLLPKWPAPRVVEEQYLHLVPGEDHAPEPLLEKLVERGYTRVSMVSKVGEMALRGDILDIACPGYDFPVRMEFFGDTLESLRLFEPLSQRSQRELEQVVLLPCTPAVQDFAYRQDTLEKWEDLKNSGELPAQAFNELVASLETNDLHIPPGLYYKNPVGIGHWLGQDTVFLVTGATDARSRLEEHAWAWKDYLEQSGHAWPLPSILQTMGQARQTWLEHHHVLFESLVMGKREKGLELLEEPIHSFDEIFWEPEKRKRPLKSLVEGLGQWKRTYRQVLVCFHSAHSRKRFLSFAHQEGLAFHLDYDPGEKGLFALVAPLTRGMKLVWCDILVLAEDVLQPRETKRITPGKGKDFKGLTSFDEISPEDFLVHRDYGLARFGGLVHMQAGAVANDYLVLLYANDDKLYLPVDRMGMVQKYKGPEGRSVALDRLGGTGWKKSKARVRKAIEKIARDLVEMYALRTVTKGYSYGPRPEIYWEFEASFGFEETRDQEQAIRDVIRDMESSKPMDRLVCGDVGFGKTEVALRAAFRAVVDGKQVALLCPTTVLAEQHYQNFRQRMEDFSVRVAMLSRFVPKQTQKLVVQAAARGEVDILIGTHRLLSKDISLPHLSLLILDEEQRFGVKHKERLKSLKQNIDVLTLTATPIPRTLQLSLSGIRGLSVIETPPLERKPVKTALMERETPELRAILERELGRMGQVFWVYNRVQGLERVRDYVQSLVPEARVATAHGQMPASELEETMHRFWHRELDVLVCTSIIESGLDFPKANTLIVDQAQLFGLGQLYQLRGRVGRSREQAYAYFVIPSLEDLQEQARKRLKVILDMDYLGAGFQVAMEDLRLRGAGNILGEVQSGTIGKVGLDMFLDILEEEVQRLKGEPVAEVREPELHMGVPAHIPEGFIVDASERLHYYRVLSMCVRTHEIDDIIQEIRDRFGPIPPALETFAEILKLKFTIRELGAVQADIYANKIVISWDANDPRIDPLKLVGWVSANKELARLIPPGKLELRCEDNPSIALSMRQLKQRLEEVHTSLVMTDEEASS
ncbi:transcription-repair coupling factor [Desulfoplanes formicivorans]|uniref:Transcription-repair-coupling factor n=1 Tax=Desulfoplanes formicivorans TaxID=1592317 RepID=A0A194AJN4_9BACT|nr:transcription-repair coupling factor [Desulfoplanes formicivorans]